MKISDEIKEVLNAYKSVVPYNINHSSAVVVSDLERLYEKAKQIEDASLYIKTKPILSDSEKKEGWEIKMVNNCWMKVLSRKALLTP